MNDLHNPHARGRDYSSVHKFPQSNEFISDFALLASNLHIYSDERTQLDSQRLFSANLTQQLQTGNIQAQLIMNHYQRRQFADPTATRNTYPTTPTANPRTVLVLERVTCRVPGQALPICLQGLQDSMIEIFQEVRVWSTILFSAI